jgi:hypothetical protein
MKITNIAKGLIIINLSDRTIELAPGQSATLDKDEAAAFKKVPALVGLIDEGKVAVDAKKVTVEDKTGGDKAGGTGVTS